MPTLVGRLQKRLHPIAHLCDTHLVRRTCSSKTTYHITDNLSGDGTAGGDGAPRHPPPLLPPHGAFQRSRRGDAGRRRPAR